MLYPDVVCVLVSFIPKKCRFPCAFVSKSWRKSLQCVMEIEEKREQKQDEEEFKKKLEKFKENPIDGIDYDKMSWYWPKPYLDKSEGVYEIYKSKKELKFLVWAVKYGCPIRKYFYEYCAKEGNIETLLFLRKIGYQWTKEIISMVAEEDNLECFKFMIENGCPWDHWSLLNAQLNDRKDIIKYIESLSL